ncbi:hypothetical protein LNTAR_03364 [Lentisphaera araneosa HTCC2155]|jgi:hypothetical protein|uniref:Uncharacterized protein n=1 Tax=Lentisphaera araneosa HTCC2155 TaxID=313628 RepID=A6DUA8_9BACT|nr:hypothetical protein [Lentisphaera araneosa]EDM24771.1 hypothetical protein LNTAR_03364 [Lentisphaera araneosa HTCC2155]
MDGIIGLIVFAVISFVYNKLIQKQDAKNGDATDLSEWLEEAEPTPAPPVQKTPNEKMTRPTSVPNSEKIKKKYVQEAIPPPPPVFNTKNTNTKTNYRPIHKESSQNTLHQQLTNTKKKKRSSLNCKDRKTLRQAFILNTVLTKPKSYEP